MGLMEAFRMPDFHEELLKLKRLDGFLYWT